MSDTLRRVASIAAALLSAGSAAAVATEAVTLRSLPRLPAPLTDADYRAVDPALADLGQLLFFDPLLSGNRNIACATCHHPSLASADGLSLGIGEGGVGLGLHRRIGADGVKHRVPRHAPALFNLGAHQFTVLFNDGRVALDPSEPSGFDTPAEEFLPAGLDSVLAAQALFPLLADVEMAGSADENEVAGARHRRVDYGWREITARLNATDGYRTALEAAYPGAMRWRPEHLGNALAAFMEDEWRSDRSPFDDWLAGNDAALDAQQLAGLALFYGEADCARCHAGALQTDHDFHALALPPLGPGRTRAFDPIARDVGRLARSDDTADAYRFRTPSLRNVALTAPYGHNGSYATLDGIVRHHLNPLASLETWQAHGLPLVRDAALDAADMQIWQDAREMARYRRHVDVSPIQLDDDEVAAVIAFLHALTDRAAIDGRRGAPEQVPSGLPLDTVEP